MNGDEWSQQTSDIRFASWYRTRLQKVPKCSGTLRSELDQNSGRYENIWACWELLGASRQNFRQTRHLTIPNIWTTALQMSKLRRTLWKSRYNCVWKTQYLMFTLLASVELSSPYHDLGRDHVIRHPRTTGGTPPPNCARFLHNSRGGGGNLERHK